MKTVTTIDDHINSFSGEKRERLLKMRSVIKNTAPDATETISYGIPTFKLQGKNLVHFAGYKHHIGFYPAPRSIEKFKQELKEYKGGKGTIQFPYDKPIPWELVERIVKFRIQEINTSKTKGGE